MRRRRSRLLVSKVSCRIDRLSNSKTLERKHTYLYLTCTHPLESYATFLFFILYMASAHLRVIRNPRCMPYKSTAKVTLISPNVLVSETGFYFP